MKKLLFAIFALTMLFSIETIAQVYTYNCTAIRIKDDETHEVIKEDEGLNIPVIWDTDQNIIKVGMNGWENQIILKIIDEKRERIINERDSDGEYRNIYFFAAYDHEGDLVFIEIQDFVYGFRPEKLHLFLRWDYVPQYVEFATTRIQ